MYPGFLSQVFLAALKKSEAYVAVSCLSNLAVKAGILRHKAPVKKLVRLLDIKTAT